MNLIKYENKESNQISLMQDGGLEKVWRVASMFAKSDIVPKQYKGKIENCAIAIDMAINMGVSPLNIMQNLDIIQGKPSWSSQYIIAMINTSGRFEPLKWNVVKTNNNLKGTEFDESSWDKNTNSMIHKSTKFNKDLMDVEFTAYAKDIKTGEILESPTISLLMAIKEGWYNKSGSKWQTIPDLMGRYRSAAFFGRLYCPDVMQGFHTKEEIQDIEYTVVDNEQSSKKTVSENANKETLKREEDAKDHEGWGIKFCGLIIVPVSKAGVGHGCMHHDNQGYYERSDIIDEVEAGGIGHG